MAVHPRVREIIRKFEAQELHAARAGREVMDALAAVVTESPLTSIDGLAEELTLNAEALLQVMPPYAPPLNVMHRVFWRLEQAQRDALAPEDFRREVASEAKSYRLWSEQARAKIASLAGRLIPDGGVVFTFTLSETVLGALRAAAASGLRFKVLVTESRPNADGCMTAQLLADQGVTVEVGIDAGVGEIVPRADLMMVGAEALLPDGSAMCKVGTYPAALVARRTGLRVYVLVDTLKAHASALAGRLLKLDPIAPRDVLAEPEASRAAVRGHLFDRTPAELITAVVTESGLIHPRQALQWMLEMPRSEYLTARVAVRHGGQKWRSMQRS